MKQLVYAASFCVVVGLAGCGRSGLGRQNITRLEYNQVREGMTYAQVVGVIGANGVEQTTTASSRQFMWNNSDRSRAIISFLNDRMVSKHWYNGTGTRRRSRSLSGFTRRRKRR